MSEEIEKLCDEAMKAAVCIHLAVESSVADSIDSILRRCVSALREMDAEYQTCNDLLGATCIRAEKAEAELAELRPENAHWQKILSKATENL